jgi:hypothetical protein
MRNEGAISRINSLFERRKANESRFFQVRSYDLHLLSSLSVYPTHLIEFSILIWRLRTPVRERDLSGPEHLVRAGTINRIDARPLGDIYDMADIALRRGICSWSPRLRWPRLFPVCLLARCHPLDPLPSHVRCALCHMGILFVFCFSYVLALNPPCCPRPDDSRSQKRMDFVFVSYSHSYSFVPFLHSPHVPSFLPQ